MISKIDLDSISTEERNDKTTNIDKLSSIEIVKLINNEDKKITEAIESESARIAEAIDICSKVFKNDNRIFYIGAGTSGRIGVLDASEMLPTFGVGDDKFIALIAGGDRAIKFPIENSEDDVKSAILDLQKKNFTKNDVLIGLSASGRTPYVDSALKYAKKLGAKTIVISTSKNPKIGKNADLEIVALVGPEAITGSTRMKSGSAQKMIINIISTGIMIRCGYVYQNLMINVQATNAKLKERAKRIIRLISNISDESLIDNLLIEANYNLKEIIISLVKKISIKESRELLSKNNFNFLINQEMN